LFEEKLKTQPSNSDLVSSLLLCRAKCGDNGVAAGLAAMRELPDRSVGACYRAAVAAEVSGDRTRALAWLEDAMNRGYALREIGNAFLWRRSSSRWK
jgi:hypothetical protein